MATKLPNVVLGDAKTEYCNNCNTDVNIYIDLKQNDNDGQYVATLSFACECNDGEVYKVETLRA